MIDIDANNSDNWYSEDNATFGDRLVAAREHAGLSQKALADKIGVKKGTLANWEDDASEPRANRLTLMAGMLGVSMRWLMTGEGEGPAPVALDTPELADVAGILAEMREVRVTMQRASSRLGQLEKKLRAAAESAT